MYLITPSGFHAIDMETGAVQDLFLPPRGTRGPINPHAIITIPRSGGTELLLCYDSECLTSSGQSSACKLH